MKFYPLTVKELNKTTSDCTIVSLDVPEELKSSFDFTQGQYLSVKATINNEEVRRSYSLCSSPEDGEWKIGVKKIEGGKFSTFVNDYLESGDQLEVASPDGRFFVPVDQETQRNYVAFAAGSGITPIISIIKTHLKREPNATFKLFYINQTVSSIILKEELESLKNQFIDRFEVYYFLTRQQRNVPLFSGRIDRSKLDIIFNGICDIEETDHYFTCGPEEMIFMIRDYLQEKGVKKDQIHFELFNTSGSQQKKARKADKQYDGKISEVTIHEGGKSINFNVAQGANNLLDEALNNAADLPFACKGGVCCTCKAKLVEGKVDMLVNYGLEEDEIEDGYILTCQALPISDKVVVDFDQ